MSESTSTRRILKNSGLCACLLALFLCAGTALAHQKRTAITTVLFNDRTGNIEVMHRFLLHDAEHAVKEIRGMTSRVNILESEATRAAFSKYVSERFFLYDQSMAVLDLTLLGSEIDGSNIWVYQEIAIPQDLTSLTVRHNALRDIWFEQVNRVNLERKGQTETLIFEGNIDSLNIDLD